MSGKILVPPRQVSGPWSAATVTIRSFDFLSHLD